jgi:hypothetical protein
MTASPMAALNMFTSSGVRPSAAILAYADAAGTPTCHTDFEIR